MKLVITESQWNGILEGLDLRNKAGEFLSKQGGKLLDKVGQSKAGQDVIKKGSEVAQDVIQNVATSQIQNKTPELSPEIQARFSDIDFERDAPNLAKMMSALGKEETNALVAQFKELPDQPIADLEKMGFKKNEMLHPLGAVATITSGVGMRKHPVHGDSRMHSGVDISAQSGTPIYAPLNGVVVKALDTTPDPCGGHIRIDHGPIQTKFCHLRKILVSKGQKVRKGQHIGYTGGGEGDPMAGTSTGPHLHYEIRDKNDQVLDPMKVSPSLA